MDEEIKRQALAFHLRRKGKLAIKSKVPLATKEDLSLAYTPGVAQPCLEIRDNPEKAYDYTSRGNMVAVVTDGSAVLGLGNIGALAGMPVMEGKCLLFKKFAGVDAFPIGISSQEPNDIVSAVKLISPSFGGINLEDISAPHCFEVEERLRAELDIPVMHDDQHGTAIVALAGITNALKLAGKSLFGAKIVVNGPGAAGVAVTKILLDAGAKEITVCGRKGAINETSYQDKWRKEIGRRTNPQGTEETLEQSIKGADVFIGLSVAGALSPDMVRSMANKPIIMAMANPVPEIMPQQAKDAKAFVVCTGRSDFPNQVNNALSFPGVFKGAFAAHATQINEEMKHAAAKALAGLISPQELAPEYVIPGIFDKRVAKAVSKAVAKAAKKSGVVRKSAG
ncbi:MAG: malic enzyme-like NAD(P)-binding protein [Candidatus Micrarchaeota archaeon]